MTTDDTPQIDTRDVIWDTDIGRDPDDFIAGCFILSRKELNLIAVTVSPGDRDQIALAKFLLKETGHEGVPVGALPGRDKGALSVQGCHLHLMDYYKVPKLSDPLGHGWAIISQAIRNSKGSGRNPVLFTSGPLNNVGDFLLNDNIPVELTVSMAGYWSENPNDFQKEFNFNGSVSAAELFVGSDNTRLPRRLLIGKNVTHSCPYDQQLHDDLRKAGENSRPLALAHELMSLRPDRKTKLLHDPLAAVALVTESIFEWEEVMPVRRGSLWASKPSSGSGIWATTKADISTFRRIFLG